MIRHLVENVQDVDVIPADDIEPDVAASLTAAVTSTPVNNVRLGTDDGDVPAAADDDVDDVCSMCHLTSLSRQHASVVAVKRNRLTGFNARDVIDGSTLCVLD